MTEVQRNAAAVSQSPSDRKEQGVTRQNILQLLRIRGQMTAMELSQELNIGAVGVRQHLMMLERDGLVRVAGLRRSVGRPSHLYVLTSEAEHHFPKNYDRLALDVLNHVTNQYGEQAAVDILAARRQALIQKYSHRLHGKPLAEKVVELSKILAEQGYMCECEQLEDGSFVLIEHNCPVDCVAREHPQLCVQELELYRELLGVPVTRDATISSGEMCCRYYIPAA